MYTDVIALGITAYFRYGIITILWNKETGFLTYIANINLPSEDQKVADISMTGICFHK